MNETAPQTSAYKLHFTALAYIFFVIAEPHLHNLTLLRVTL